MSLYGITTDLSHILDRIMESGSDSPEVQAELDATLEGLDAALEEKADDYCGLIRELELRADSRAAEAKRIRALADADANLAHRLKDRLKGAMETTGKLKLSTARFALTVATNGGKQPLEIDPTAIAVMDDALVVVKREPNKDAIRAALEAGESVPGCTLLPRGTSLRVR
jgi:hypothetical protein